MIQKAIVDSKAERIKARAMRQIASSLIKYRTETSENVLNTHHSNVSHSEEKLKSRTPSAFGYHNQENQQKGSSPRVKYINKLSNRSDMSKLHYIASPNKGNSFFHL